MRSLSLLAAAALVAAPGLLAAQEAERPRVVGPPTAVVVSGPQVGSAAPDFTLGWGARDTTSDGSFSYNLRRDRGKVVVLAFYPEDFTPSATRQLERFRDEAGTLFGPDVVVLGVSVDPPARHRRFAASLDLPFRLLSDPGQRVARAYGSRGPHDRARRSVYVIGAEGNIRYRDFRFDAWDDASYKRLAEAVAAAKQPQAPAPAGGDGR